MNSRATTVCIVTSLISLIIAGAAPATATSKPSSELKLTINGRPEHPTVYLSRADIAQARANRDRYPWARAAASRLITEADKWANREEADVLATIPPPASCYAYGFTGCPVCGGTLKSWWGAGGVASLDDPRHIRCVNGHRLPDEKHPDPGHGYTDPAGKKYYFVGTYNSFVIDTLNAATTNLVHAYALTGEERYAERAAVILDNLARIYPTSETGSWDYPSDPPSGRFNRPWYQVARTLVIYTNQYDILLMGKTLDRPSSNPGMTRRENIERNMLLNGARYCYVQSVKHPALHNGQCDYVRGATCVGVAMGIPEYVAWGVDGPYSIRAMIANNVDRDGQYYETTAGYSDHARALYMDVAQMLANYKDAAHPNGVRLIDDPVFVSFNLLARARLRSATHPPNLGDDAPNAGRSATTRPADRLDVGNLERLRALMPNESLDRELGGILLSLAGGNLESLRASVANDWLLFHARDVEGVTGPATAATNLPQGIIHPLSGVSLDQSDLFGQKGLAILRSGIGEHARAFTLRVGPTLNHGHFDEMNLNIFARGYEMSYDLGYSLGSTHTQVGWAKQTASHNTVLVDETPQLQSGRAGGSITAFAALPGLQFVSGANSAAYASQKVTRYDRAVAMIDASDEDSYLLDIFRVVGGSKHDYVFHGRGTAMTTDGLELGPEQPGSLAGPELDWGNQQGSDGNMKGVVGKEYWNPPPGNGLGFLVKPRLASPPQQPWSATWEIDAKDDARMRLTMLPSPGTRIVTAEAPGIYPHFPRAGYVLARRAGENLSSTFAAIIEPYGKRRVVKQISRIGEPSDSAVAIKVELGSGGTDYLVWRDIRDNSAARSWQDGPLTIGCDGHFAKISVRDGRPTDACVIGGSLQVGTLKLTCESPALRGDIDRIDFQRNVLYTKVPLPIDNALAGQFLFSSNPAYFQSSPYRIASVSREGDTTAIQLAPTRLALAQFTLAADPTSPTELPNNVPLEYGKSLAHKSSGFFQGKRIAAVGGSASTTVRDNDGQGLTIAVESSAGFAKGQELTIFDLWPGDAFQIPAYIQATRDPSGGWQTASNAGGKVTGE